MLNVCKLEKAALAAAGLLLGCQKQQVVIAAVASDTAVPALSLAAGD